MKDCNSCGKCCIKYGGQDLSVSQSEIELWDVFHPELLDYVKKGEIWFDPKTGQQVERCPFLKLDESNKGYLCEIYFARPDDCKFYPSTVQEMIFDECEMIEPKDKLDLKLAQKKLDKLMQDSRLLS